MTHMVNVQYYNFTPPSKNNSVHWQSLVTDLYFLWKSSWYERVQKFLWHGGTHSGLPVWQRCVKTPWQGIMGLLVQKRLRGMTALTLHIPWHVPLFPIRSRESQGFSLDFGQHVSAAGLSWRLRTARRDTWTREPHALEHTSARAKCLYTAILSTFCLCLSSNYRTMLWIRSLIHTSQTRSNRPGCIAGRCVYVCARARVCSDSTSLL